MIFAAGYVSRVWGAVTDDASYVRLVHQGVHFIALDDFRQTAYNGGEMRGILHMPEPPHHHHKRDSNCEHGQWATDDE